MWAGVLFYALEKGYKYSNTYCRGSLWKSYYVPYLFKVCIIKIYLFFCYLKKIYILSYFNSLMKVIGFFFLLNFTFLRVFWIFFTFDVWLIVYLAKIYFNHQWIIYNMICLIYIGVIGTVIYESAAYDINK